MKEQLTSEEGSGFREEGPVAGVDLVAALNRAGEIDKCQREEPGREVAMVSRAVAALRRRGVRAGEILTLLTAVGLGACATSHGDEVYVKTSQEYVAATRMIERQPNSRLVETPAVTSAAEKHAEHEKLRAELLEITGVDMLAIAEKAGYDVHIEVKNPNPHGNYFCKIDMIHKTDGTMKHPDEVRKVIKSQKGVYGLLLGLEESGLVKDIFPEAVTEKNVDEFELMREAHRYLADASGGLLGFESFAHATLRAYAPDFREGRVLDGDFYRERYEEFKKAAKTDRRLAAAMETVRPILEPLLFDEVSRLGPDGKFFG